MNTFKRLFSIACIISIVSVGAQAQSSRAKVQELMQAMDMQATGKATLNMMFDQLKKMPLASGTADNFWDNFIKEIDYNEFIEMYIPIYQKHFTDAEIDELIAFYNSPIGKKFVAKTPYITSESMAAGQEWGMKVATKVMEKLQKR